MTTGQNEAGEPRLIRYQIDVPDPHKISLGGRRVKLGQFPCALEGVYDADGYGMVPTYSEERGAGQEWGVVGTVRSTVSIPETMRETSGCINPGFQLNGCQGCGMKNSLLRYMKKVVAESVHGLSLTTGMAYDPKGLKAPQFTYSLAKKK